MECNDTKFEDLYETIKGMSPWERMKLVDEFIHDASDVGLASEVDFRRYVQSCSEHMGDIERKSDDITFNV